MVTFFKNDFNKIQNYKKKIFKIKNLKILNFIDLKCFFKKLNKTKKKRKIFSDLFFLFKRLESFSFSLPKIYKLKLLKKNKKNLKIKAMFLIKLNLNYFHALNFINFLFIKNFYFYVNFLLKMKHKYLYFEEVLKPMFKKNLLIKKKNLLFKFNIYYRWIDFSRKFIKLKKAVKFIGFKNYKLKKKKVVAIKKLKFIKMFANIKSNFVFCFFNFVHLIIKNYYKIIVFLYKKFRKKKLKI